MDKYLYRRRIRDEQSHTLLHPKAAGAPAEQGPIDDLEEVPPAVRYQELRELTKLRYVMRRARKAKPTTFWRKLQRWYFYPFMEVFMTVLCLFLPEIYKERYRKLSYAVLEPDTWPKMFTEPQARRRAAAAWKSYANSLVDEWNSSNVIAALVLSAAGSFLAIPDINNVTRYALMITLLSSLASLAHATYHAHYWRNILDDRHYSMLQLRCYISCNRPINRFLLCQPMLNLICAMASFSIGILAYLWPAAQDTSGDTNEVWRPNAAAKIAISVIYGWQIGLIGVSYKWNRSAFFTTNELLVGEDGRSAKVYEEEAERGEIMMREMEEDMDLARNIPVIENTTPKAFSFIKSIPMYSMLSPNLDDRTRGAPSPSTAEVRNDPEMPTPEPATGPVRWVTDSMGHVPDGAVPLGFENPRDPGQLYVGRMFYKGRWRSGRVGDHILSSFPYQGKEVVSMVEYDVLCGDQSNFVWLKIPEGESFDATTPLPEAFEFLTAADVPSKDGNAVYIAAADHAGGRQLGEVLHGATAASIPFTRVELRLTPFFVLLVKKQRGSAMNQSSFNNGLLYPEDKTV